MSPEDVAFLAMTAAIISAVGGAVSAIAAFLMWRLQRRMVQPDVDLEMALLYLAYTGPAARLDPVVGLTVRNKGMLAVDLTSFGCLLRVGGGTGVLFDPRTPEGASAIGILEPGRSRTAVFDLQHLARMHHEHTITGAFVDTAAHGRMTTYRDGAWLVQAAVVEADRGR